MIFVCMDSSYENVLCAILQVSDPSDPAATHTSGLLILAHFATSGLPSNSSEERNSQASGVSARALELMVWLYKKIRAH